MTCCQQTRTQGDGWLCTRQCRWGFANTQPDIHPSGLCWNIAPLLSSSQAWLPPPSEIPFQLLGILLSFHHHSQIKHPCPRSCCTCSSASVPLCALLSVKAMPSRALAMCRVSSWRNTAANAQDSVLTSHRSSSTMGPWLH